MARAEQVVQAVQAAVAAVAVRAALVETAMVARQETGMVEPVVSQPLAEQLALVLVGPLGHPELRQARWMMAASSRELDSLARCRRPRVPPRILAGLRCC